MEDKWSVVLWRLATQSGGLSWVPGQGRHSFPKETGYNSENKQVAKGAVGLAATVTSRRKI